MRYRPPNAFRFLDRGGHTNCSKFFGDTGEWKSTQLPWTLLAVVPSSGPSTLLPAVLQPLILHQFQYFVLLKLLLELPNCSKFSGGKVLPAPLLLLMLIRFKFFATSDFTSSSIFRIAKIVSRPTYC